MDRYTLEKAMRLEKEREELLKRTNQSYNGHMYIGIMLDGTDITKDIDMTQIEKNIYEQYRDKLTRVEKEIKEL